MSPATHQDTAPMTTTELAAALNDLIAQAEPTTSQETSLQDAFAALLVGADPEQAPEQADEPFRIS